MGSISYAVPWGSSVKKEVAKYAANSYKGELIASNFAPGDPGGMAWGGWGGYHYGAHRMPDGQVYASVIAFGQYKGDVYIKAMDEGMGPNADGASLKVLGALTPTDDEYANQWRERAHRYHEKRQAAKEAVGKLIKLGQPINLSDGSSIQYVEVVSLNRWRRPFGGRIRPGNDWFLSDWEVASRIEDWNAASAEDPDPREQPAFL